MDEQSGPHGTPKRADRGSSARRNGAGGDLAWHALSILLAGPLTWGAVGAAIDHFAGTGRVFLPIGIVVGAVTGFYIVIVRFGRENG